MNPTQVEGMENIKSFFPRVRLTKLAEEVHSNLTSYPQIMRRQYSIIISLKKTFKKTITFCVKDQATCNNLKAQYTTKHDVDSIVDLHEVPFSMLLQVAGGPGMVSEVHSVRQLTLTGVLQQCRLHVMED